MEFYWRCPVCENTQPLDETVCDVCERGRFDVAELRRKFSPDGSPGSWRRRWSAARKAFAFALLLVFVLVLGMVAGRVMSPGDPSEAVRQQFVETQQQLRQEQEKLRAVRQEQAALQQQLSGERKELEAVRQQLAEGLQPRQATDPRKGAQEASTLSS